MSRRRVGGAWSPSRVPPPGLRQRDPGRRTSSSASLMPGSVARATSRRSSDGAVDRERGHLELLAAGLHRLHGALEHDLEAGQLLVAEVLGLVAQAAGLGLGVVDDLLGRCWASRTTSVRCTIRSAWTRAASRISSASRWTLARNSSRSLSIQRAWPAAPRAAGRAPPRAARGPRPWSSRTDADSGIVRALYDDLDRRAAAASRRRGGRVLLSHRSRTTSTGNFSFRRRSTGSGTMADTGRRRPNAGDVADQLRGDERLCDADGMNSVSMPEMPRSSAPAARTRSRRDGAEALDDEVGARAP